MTFVDELASGIHGIRITLPASLQPLEHDTHMAAFTEPSTATGWWFFVFPDLRLVLDPAHHALHRRDTLHHTRALFDTMYRVLNPTPGPAKPRTDDATWTPLIELEPFELGVTVLHRMSYQPAHETIMGHTLIPLAGGLFEARWACPTIGPTGVRESFLLAGLMQAPDAPFPPRQDVYDAPEHDAQFASHPLSRARRAKVWHQGRVEVTAAAPPPARTHELAELGLTVTLPPRFQYRGTVALDGSPAALFDRVSFSGTDGVDRLVVAWARKPFRSDLVRTADQQAAMFLGDGVTGLETRALDGGARVTEGEGSGTRNRVIGRWFLRGDRLATVAIVTTVALPIEELLADIATVAGSW